MEYAHISKPVIDSNCYSIEPTIDSLYLDVFKLLNKCYFSLCILNYDI